MDEFFSIGHRALSRVSLAVLLLDDLTGKQIVGSNARAWIEKAKPPIKKNDGWFVFTDLTPGEYSVNTEGGKYLSGKTVCKVDTGNMKTIIIRLKPGRVYPVPKDCLRVEGKAEPLSEITVVNCHKSASMKLTSDCKSGDMSISVFHPDGIRLDGLTFRLTTNGTDSEDISLLPGVSGEETYRLTEPLKNDHSRIGTLLMPVATATADENGNFFMILKGVPASAKLICEAKGTQTVIKEYEQPDMTCFRPVLI